MLGNLFSYLYVIQWWYPRKLYSIMEQSIKMYEISAKENVSTMVLSALRQHHR